MTIALSIITTGALAVAVVAFLLARTAIQDGKVERDQMRERHARDLAGHRATIDMLCQRIQAPETAVAQHAAEGAPHDPPPVNLENDEEMAELREERELWPH